VSFLTVAVFTPAASEFSEKLFSSFDYSYDAREGLLLLERWKVPFWGL